VAIPVLSDNSEVDVLERLFGENKMLANAQPRVLVVDDEPEMQKVLSDILRLKLTAVGTNWPPY
jgi:hypothetical protein